MIELALLIAGAILAGIAQLQAEGKSILAWGVILIAIALLYARLVA